MRHYSDSYNCKTHIKVIVIVPISRGRAVPSAQLLTITDSDDHWQVAVDTGTRVVSPVLPLHWTFVWTLYTSYCMSSAKTKFGFFRSGVLGWTFIVLWPKFVLKWTPCSHIWYVTSLYAKTNLSCEMLSYMFFAHIKLFDEILHD